jgi:hypothetical protein
MSDDPSAALSAASVLLAVIAILFSLWYSAILDARDIAIPDHLEDAGPQRRQVRNALLSQAVPLTIGCVVLAVAFVPEAVRLGHEWIELAGDNGLEAALNAYDSVELSLFLVVLSMIGFAVWSLRALLALILIKRKLG